MSHDNTLWRYDDVVKCYDADAICGGGWKVLILQSEWSRDIAAASKEIGHEEVFQYYPRERPLLSAALRRNRRRREER